MPEHVDPLTAAIRAAVREEFAVLRAELLAARADSDCLTIDEAGNALRKSRRTITRMIARGQLRSVKTGARVLVPRDAVAEILRGAR